MDYLTTCIETEHFKIPQQNLDHEDINSIMMYKNKSTICDDMIWDDLALMNAASYLKP